MEVSDSNLCPNPPATQLIAYTLCQCFSDRIYPHKLPWGGFHCNPGGICKGTWMTCQLGLPFQKKIWMGDAVQYPFCKEDNLEAVFSVKNQDQILQLLHLMIASGKEFPFVQCEVPSLQQASSSYPSSPSLNTALKVPSSHKNSGCISWGICNGCPVLFCCLAWQTRWFPPPSQKVTRGQTLKHPEGPQSW